jgi:hypothetical protein
MWKTVTDVLSCCAGFLKGSPSGIQYERRRYADAVGDNDPSVVLPKTRDWLQSGFVIVSLAGLLALHTHIELRNQ